MTPATPAPQLTIRAVLLGVVLASLMAAANTYLGLFAGLTIASAIPSAVVSMAVLKLLGGGGILENNIVQTGGSAGSSVATGVLFTTPALVMLGAWHDYPYGSVFAFAALGGLLGVLFSVPLRRALIVQQKLPFPEGTAAAEVLRAGADPQQGARLLASAGMVGATLKLLAANGLQLIPDDATVGRYFGRSIGYAQIGLSPALVGVGYICGFNVGLVMLAGGLICWNIAVPVYTGWFLADNAPLAAAISGLPAADAAEALWSRHLRFIGVGAMLIGSLWTLFTLRGALLSGIRAGMAVARTAGNAAGGQPETDRDLPLRLVAVGCLVTAIPLMMMYRSVVGSTLVAVPLTLLMIVLAFLFCSVSAYMAGIVGSSNDPVSGMLISTVLAASALMFVLTQGNAYVGPVAAVMIAATVCSALSIAGDNVQDLKCGQLVGATPWRQQVMIAVGGITSATVLAPVLNLLHRAYGIGVPDALHPHPLLAPQATMITAVSRGLFGGHLPWNMIIVGVFIGAAIIAADAWLAARNAQFRVPVLAVSVGIYLPLYVSSTIFAGALVARLARRGRAPGESEDLGGRGMLFAAGMVAGESLTGVLLAIPIMLSGRADVLSLPARLQLPGSLGAGFGVALLAGAGALLYRVASRRNATAPAAAP